VFSFLLIVQCALALLMLIAVALQKGASDMLGGLKSSPTLMPEETNKFLLRVTTVLVVLFFFNSLLLAKLSCKVPSMQKYQAPYKSQ
jgi:protein translocase SecG subunit